MSLKLISMKCLLLKIKAGVFFNRQDSLFLVLLMWQFETGSVENEKPWLPQMCVGGLCAEAGGVVLGATVGRH